MLRETVVGRAHAQYFYDVPAYVRKTRADLHNTEYNGLLARTANTHSYIYISGFRGFDGDRTFRLYHNTRDVSVQQQYFLIYI